MNANQPNFQAETKERKAKLCFCHSIQFDDTSPLYETFLLHLCSKLDRTFLIRKCDLTDR